MCSHHLLKPVIAKGLLLGNIASDGVQSFLTCAGLQPAKKASDSFSAPHAGAPSSARSTLKAASIRGCVDAFSVIEAEKSGFAIAAMGAGPPLSVAVSTR